ncbi:MAG: STAS domain-containing protein [Pirellulaceae bacterium]|nr:STAS domain-containing protein [Pirellulaceae bacterium]
MTGYKHFQVEQIGDVTALRLVDPKLFDMLLVNEVQDELLGFLDEQRPDKLLVDFAHVSSCSTTIINGLLRAKMRLVARHGCLKLCCMQHGVRVAFSTLNLDGTVFEIYATAADAVGAFQGDVA